MLKGKTIIELTDTKTGEVEKFEDNNLITNAINEIILKRKNYIGFSTQDECARSDLVSSFTSMFPLYRGFFGGIMLFENTIDESRKYLTGDDKIIGSATFGNAYSGADPVVGSYNSTESEINETEKYAKFVYDFATNQGNGTISSVCLGNYHYIKHALYGKSYKDDYVISQLANLLNSPNTGQGWGSNSQDVYKPHYVLFPTGIQFSNGVPWDYDVKDSSDYGFCYETPILFDDSKGHLITLEYCSSKGTITYSRVADTIRLHVYDIGTNTVSLFENFDNSHYNRLIPKEIFTKDFAVTSFGNYGVYNLNTKYSKQGWYDKSTGCAYLLGDTTDTSLDYWTNNKVMTLFKFNLNVENYDGITIETVEITNKTGKQIYVSSTHMSKLYGKRKICIKDGYLYVPLGTSNTSQDGFAKINIQDSTDVTVVKSGGYKFVCDVQGDFLYMGYDTGYGSTTYVQHFNTKTNEIKYTRVRYGYHSHAAMPIPFKHNEVYIFYTGGHSTSTPDDNNPDNYYKDGNYLYWYGTICSRNDYLATINNLDTPVTKTSDKTMKITYILREE